MRLDLLFFERVKDITHLATIINSNGLEERRFLSDAEGILSREPGYESIGFFSLTGDLLFSVPQINTYLQKVSPGTVSKALEDTSAIFTPPIAVQNEKVFTVGILVPVPQTGVAAGMLRIEKIILEVIKETTPYPQYAEVYIENRSISGSPMCKDSENNTRSQRYVTSFISKEIMGLQWGVRIIRPVEGRYERLFEEGRLRYIITQIAVLFAGGLLFLSFAALSRAESSEKRLEISEGRYRRLTENARDLIFRFNCSEKRFEYVSPASLDLTGYAPEDFYSNPAVLEQIIAPEWRGYWDQSWKNLVEEGKAESVYEFRIIGKDKQSRWLHFRAVVIFGEMQDHPFAIEGTVTDITELKTALEEREKLINELEAKNAELERFAYTISHELKTPLITIRGFLGYLVKEAQEGDIGGLYQDVSLIRTATDTMNKLLEGLIELTRVGRSPVEPEVVDLADLAREVLNKFRRIINEKNIDISISDDMPPVYGNKMEFSELIINLIENGIKFMGDRPDPKIRVGWYRENQDVIFYVRDNGIGIERKYQERIFGIFNKLDPRSDGAGVGLSLARRIVVSHGGWIRVRSEGPGKGSSFEFTLPLA
ncbi:Signal transduction histidine kinase [Chitinispirillum alkaliphilum]|nr:Signal transduction histidine kinase [Chitinispirillum alkaliphilum]